MTENELVVRLDKVKDFPELAGSQVNEFVSFVNNQASLRGYKLNWAYGETKESSSTEAGDRYLEICYGLYKSS